jgi:nucleotide-binding universal stress UspA family protein
MANKKRSKQHMKKLLVTTDFSINSKAGMRFAFQLAKQSGCEITFLHSTEILKPTSWSDKKFKDYAQGEIEKNRTHLKKFIEDVVSELGIRPKPYAYEVIIGMNVSDLVMNFSKKLKVDYICLSTRGAGAVEKLFGTHSSYLINHSSIPVIVVPEHYHTHPIKTVWYSCDMENVGNELKVVESFATSIKAKTQLNHYNYLLDDKPTKAKLEAILKKYRSVKTAIKLRKLNLDHSLVHTIENDIKNEHPSIVALFTKQNRNWFSRFFLGSNSAELSFATHTPLIVFRKKGK